MLQIYHFPLLAVGLLFYFLFQRWYRLRSIPGPWITSYTDLWRVYHQRGGRFPTKLRQLHEQYGPLVRLGPNTVCVGDASAISTIYTMHGEFKKADSYAPIRGYSNGKVMGSFVDLQDEEKVTGIRRALGSAFATKNLLEYEDDVDTAINSLLERLSVTSTFEADTLYRQFQIDFLNKAAFGEPPHILATDGDLEPYNLTPRLTHAFKWQGAPNIEHFLYKTRIMNFLRASPAPPLWIRTAAAKIQARSEQESKTEGPRDLLDKYVAASKQYPQFLGPAEVLRVVSSTVSAGYDTTYLTLMFNTVNFLNHPDKYAKLQKEIDDANLSSPPKWTEVNTLPYLDAFIKETLRMRPLVSQPMERVVPAGGSMVCGKFIPGGTTIGAAAAAVHYDRKCFGEDVYNFRPERWIEADHDQRIYMDKGYLAFGSGKRNCIGKHIAELELKKVIPAVLMNYKFYNVNSEKIKVAETRIVYQEPIEIGVQARK